jgi:hypothetical protein
MDTIKEAIGIREIDPLEVECIRKLVPKRASRQRRPWHHIRSQVLCDSLRFWRREALARLRFQVRQLFAGAANVTRSGKFLRARQKALEGTVEIDGTYASEATSGQRRRARIALTGASKLIGQMARERTPSWRTAPRNATPKSRYAPPAIDQDGNRAQRSTKGKRNAKIVPLVMLNE